MTTQDANAANAAAADAARIRKRSVVVAGHRTSISVEDAFWQALQDIAAARGVSVNQLIAAIDRNRQGNLSSAIRLFVLAEAVEGRISP